MHKSFYINMSDWGGRSYGDGSWAEPAYYGSEKFVFIEDNCFNNTSGNQLAGVIRCLARRPLRLIAIITYMTATADESWD